MVLSGYNKCNKELVCILFRQITFLGHSECSRELGGNTVLIEVDSHRKASLELIHYFCNSFALSFSIVTSFVARGICE